MRIFVPGQGVRLPMSSSQYPSSGYITLKDGTAGYGCTPVRGELVDVSDYFWDTDGRQMNNCLHSKLVVKDVPADTYRSYTVGNGYAAGGEYLIFNGEGYVWSRYNTLYSTAIANQVLRQTERDWEPVYVTAFTSAGARGNAILPTGYTLNFNNGSTLDAYVLVSWANRPITRKTWVGGHAASVSCNYSYNSDRTEILIKVNSSGIPGLARDTVIGSLPLSLKDREFSRMEEAADLIRSYCEVYLNLLVAKIVDYLLSTRSTQTWRASTFWWLSQPKLPEVSESNFILEEPTLIRDSIPLVTNPLAGYWRSWLIQHAYVDACESVPVMSDNNISNIFEVVKFIKALVLEHRIEIPRSLQDIWLTYRYSYSTTRSDVEEAINFVHRYMDLGDLSSGISCHGVARHTYLNALVTCRCRFDIAPREVGFLKEVWRTLYTYGLAPDFYVLWDSLPYSFMVDWFIPIGDMASVADAEYMYCGDTYDISNVCFSLQYDISGEGGYTYHQYSRWASKPLPMFNELYWLDKPSVRDKTLLYRILDVASIFVK